MGRNKEPEVFHGLAVFTHDVPNRRVNPMTRHEYAPIGSLYSSYRQRRRTWLYESERKPVAEFVREAESLVERLREVKIENEIRPLCEAMFLLAPALLDDSDGWHRFKIVIADIRSVFEEQGATARQLPEGHPGIAIFRSRLHALRKQFRHQARSQFEISLLSVLFMFARTVGERKNWKRDFNRWVKGIKAAQNFEIDSFDWSHRACLIEARRQLVVAGRVPVLPNPEIFNRTRIKKRAEILFHIASNRHRSPLTLSELRTLILEKRKSGQGKKPIPWESYLGKLPERPFPKKPVV